MHRAIVFSLGFMLLPNAVAASPCGGPTGLYHDTINKKDGTGAAQSIEGYWSGTIDREDVTSTFSLRISRKKEVYGGVFDWPDAGYFHESAIWVKKDGENLHVSLPLPRGALRLIGSLHGSQLTGKLEEIGNVAGAWTTVNTDGYFDLKRGKEASPPYIIEEVNFQNDGVKLAGSLLLPKGNGPFPAFVFLAGSGDTTRGGGMYLGDKMVRRGIAVLIYDKRGTGKSAGNWRDVGFEELGGDGAAGLRLLLARSDIDARRAGFVCESQGCWIGPLAISRGAPAKYLVSWSGPTVTVEYEGFEEYHNRLREAGLADSEFKKTLPLLKLDNLVSEGKASWNDLQREIAKDKDSAWYKAINWEAMPIDDPERKFYGRMLTYDPKRDIENFKIPSLWIYGTNDITIPVRASMDRLRTMHVSQQPEIVLLRDADHSMTVREDGNLPHIARGFPDLIGDWILRL